MKRLFAIAVVASLLGSSAIAQQTPPAAPAAPATPAPLRPYFVGNPIGVPAAPPNPNATTPPVPFVPMSANVRVYGSFRSAESCSYDPGMDLIVVTNMGIAQSLTANDGYISLINHDGTVHTPKWIGIMPAGNARTNMQEPILNLNQPFGSDIVNGILYVADSNGGTPDPANAGQNLPTIGVIRMFDMATGIPTGSIVVEGSLSFNDIEVAEDGTIYATQTGNADNTQPGRVYKINPDGTSSIFIAEGGALSRPNGVAIDPAGNIVVVNIGDANVLTYNPAGELINTEHASQAGNDGLVIMPDGTKYVSSVTLGGISKIVPGQASVLIAEGVPSAASMCYDPTANQLVIPMNNNNAIALISLN